MFERNALFEFERNNNKCFDLFFSCSISHHSNSKTSSIIGHKLPNKLWLYQDVRPQLSHNTRVFNRVHGTPRMRQRNKNTM